MPIKGPSGRRPVKQETQSQPIAEHLPGERTKEPDREAQQPFNARIVWTTIVVVLALVIGGGIYALT